MTRTPTIAALALSVALLVTGCSGDDSDTAAAEPSASQAPTSEAAPTPPQIDGPMGPLQFEMATSDGSADVQGQADGCDNPDEESLSTSFTDGTTTVTIDASGGSGSIVVSGGTEYEGTIESLQVGDDGTVSITGTGGAADDSAGAGAFAIAGSCALPESESESGSASGPTFSFTTADGDVVEGPAGACTNPDEETLKVSFEDDGTTVDVDVSGGSGSVRLSGGTEFEGTVESVTIGDDGSVMLSGTGSPADPGASPTTFEVSGSCAG